MSAAVLWPSLAVQGHAGAYAHMAAQALQAEATMVFCPTFEAALQAVEEGRAAAAVIPIENSTMGRIADIHQLLPQTKLKIVAETYLPVQHCLLGCPGATLAEVRSAHSQLPALAQCAQRLAALGLTPVPTADTAGAAKAIAAQGDPRQAAVASRLAAEVYGLEVLIEGLNDQPHNTTRFIVLGPEARVPAAEPAKVSLMFTTRNIPAALYKALGGFATHGLNITKLESYVRADGSFTVAQFYLEVLAHPAHAAYQGAMDELRFYAAEVRELGSYPVAPRVP